MAAKPPPELVAAIQKAVKGTGISVGTMVGIWRIESASTYPNPAKNGLGYGGLFGTTLWDGSTQAQADLAVSILNHWYVYYGGDMAKALSKYSGGGGIVPAPKGYDHVDGSGGTTGANVGSAPQGGDTSTPPTPTPAPAASEPQFIPPTSASPFQPDVELPGSQSYTIGQPHIVQSLWSQVNQGSFVSPEAQMLGDNAQAATG